MLTQDAIAKLAGLSRMTVYRYLKGKGVSAKTRILLEQILAKTRYRPNLTARSLVLQRTNLIGLLVPSVSYSFYPDIIQAIQRTVKASGYRVLLTVSNEDPLQEREEINLLLSIPVDGVVIIPTSSGESELNCKALASEQVDFVMVDRYFDAVRASYVATDSVAASKKIVQYLIDLGHRRIAHFGEPPTNSFARGVYDGYVAAHRENGLAPDDRLIYFGSMEGKDVPGMLGQALRMEEPPSAVQAVNDINAIAVMREADKHNIRIPHELSLVGFSDIDTAQLLRVPLTTVREPVALMGEEAARILLSRLNTKRKERVAKLLEGEIVIRQSARRPGF